MKYFTGPVTWDTGDWDIDGGARDGRTNEDS